jgi:hypothetical protein
MRRRPLLLALACLLGASADAGAQSLCPPGVQGGLAPTLLQDGDGRRALGIGLSLEACRSEHDLDEAFSRSTYSGGRLHGMIPLSSGPGLPQNLEASLQRGISVALARRRPVALDDDPDADLYDFNHGFAAAGGRIGYESSADFREQALAGGAEVRWVDPRRPLLPSVLATWEWVRPVRSHARDLLGIDPGVHGRLALRGYWLAPLPAGLDLELDGTVFRGFGIEEAPPGGQEGVGQSEEEGQPSAALLAAGIPDRGRFLRTTLGFAWERPLGPLRVESLFVGYARGRLPTGTEGAQAWTVGAELQPRR